MSRHVRAVAAASVLIAVGSALAGPPGELTLATGYWSGDYGDEVRTETHATTLRYIVGNDLQFRAEVPLVRVRSSTTVAASASGHGPSETGTQSQTHGGGGLSTGPGGGIDADVSDAWVSGLGDLRLAVARAVVGGGVKLFSLDAGAQIKVPTADSTEGLGTGEWDLRAGLSGEYRFWSATLFGGAGWTRFGDPEWVELQDGVDLYLGLEGSIFKDSVAISGWVDAHQEMVAGRGEPTVIGLEVRSLRRARWRVAFTAGLGSAAEDFGVILGYSFYSGAASTGRRGIVR
jgi:hypothetical protein